MSNFAVRVEELGKQFRIGKEQKKYRTFRETISEAFTSPVRRAYDIARGQAYGAAGLSEEIWALRDVSFTVNHGEVVGVIGHNGAGKSTLLKILSRITEPSEGFAEIRGHVGALLEVGTGFHQELTGRENVYLNGSILGMRRDDIDLKFDDIVGFSEIGKFIDTPVKHYSSGMRLRLGFAVAAFLEPEILLIDEVLAVGDVSFQQRCLGKMNDISQQGRTVFFVSHNLTAISSLTPRCILLKDGHIVADGETLDIIAKYLEMTSGGGSHIEWEVGARPGDKDFEFIACQLSDGSKSEFYTQEEVPVEIMYRVKHPVLGLRVGFDLVSVECATVFRTYHDDDATEIPVVQPGIYKSTTALPANFLNGGRYYLDLRANIHGVRHICNLEKAITFQTINVEGVNSVYGGRRPGIINPLIRWKIETLDSGVLETV